MGDGKSNKMHMRDEKVIKCKCDCLCKCMGKWSRYFCGHWFYYFSWKVYRLASSSADASVFAEHRYSRDNSCRHGYIYSPFLYRHTLWFKYSYSESIYPSALVWWTLKNSPSLNLYWVFISAHNDCKYIRVWWEMLLLTNDVWYPLFFQ